MMEGNKMKIKLFCAAGMSTSMLVKKMQEAAKKQELDVEIAAYPESEIKNHLQDMDVALLGPQIQYKLKEDKVLCDGAGIPIAVIPMMDYGMLNGEKVLKMALELK